MDNSFEEYVTTELAPQLSKQTKPTIFLLSCIDYRYAQRIVDVMDNHDLRRKYDIFSLAGAAAGANRNPNWLETLVQHIKTARSIGHPIEKLIILEHRDCGAYKAFGLIGEWDKTIPLEDTRAHASQVELLSKNKEIKALKLEIKAFLLPREEDDHIFGPKNKYP